MHSTAKESIQLFPSFPAILEHLQAQKSRVEFTFHISNQLRIDLSGYVKVSASTAIKDPSILKLMRSCQKIPARTRSRVSRVRASQQFCWRKQLLSAPKNCHSSVPRSGKAGAPKKINTSLRKLLFLNSHAPFLSRWYLVQPWTNQWNGIAMKDFSLTANFQF